MTSQSREPGESADAFARFFRDAAARWLPSGEGPPGADAAAQVQKIFFDTLSEFWREYVRSPHYLELMRQSLAGALEFQRHLSDFVTSALRGQAGPAADPADAESAFGRIESELLRRVEALTRRLDALEGRRPSGGAARRPAGRQRPRASRPRRAGRAPRRGRRKG
jgi:hypothetical protein